MPPASRYAAAPTRCHRCLEERDEMPAIASEVVEAEREGVELACRSRVPRVIGPDGIELTLRHPARTRRLHPVELRVEVEGTTQAFGADLVVTAIGQVPEVSSLDGAVVDGAVEWSRAHVRIAPDTGATSHPRVFAAGDLTPGERTVTGAIASGLRAAWGLDREPAGQGARGRASAPAARLRGPALLAPRGFAPPTVRSHPRRPGRPHAPARARSGGAVASFDEVVGCFTEEQARAEAARCMICGLLRQLPVLRRPLRLPCLRDRARRAGGQRADQHRPSPLRRLRSLRALCPNGAIHPVDRARRPGGPGMTTQPDRRSAAAPGPAAGSAALDPLRRVKLLFVPASAGRA